MSAEDKFPFDEENSPALNAMLVTPDDSGELSMITRALFIGIGGNIKCILKNDSDPVTFNNIVSGSILPLRVKKVFDTDTTALNIIGLY